ncbi:MAG: hypothetical protein SCK29_07180 [Bacillota bacterium]|nr:hypothetical protein [Bacillota bacterium]MDW7683882.1 hypothetical protein [Bacillota bacterium]
MTPPGKITREAIIASPTLVVEVAKQNRLGLLNICRSEPTINAEYFYHLGLEAQEHGIGTLLFTNGYSTPYVTEQFTKSMLHAVIGVKAAFDQAGYDKVVSGGRRVDVNKILDTILDFRACGASYSLSVIVDGANSDACRAYAMLEKLKAKLTDREVASLEIVIDPVIQYTDSRAILDMKTGSYICDQLNRRPGDILGVLELEAAVKSALGFKNCRSDYSADYKAIHGHDPCIFPDPAKGGCLDAIEKEQRTLKGVKNYFYFDFQRPTLSVDI